MKSSDYDSNIDGIKVADLHGGKTPKHLRVLWLEGKLTSPGAAQQGYWAQREFIERLKKTRGASKDEYGQNEGL